MSPDQAAEPTLAWTEVEVKQAEETAEQTWAAVERAQAETALRQSELKYRILFESIDQGFCICEMLFDQNGTPYDYRFLEVSSTFEQLTGLEQATGKTARELVPDLEAFWFNTYGRVVQTGESVRFENQAVAMNRWFDVNAFRMGEPQTNQFGILFTNISDRKRAEQALRESEEQSRNILESITDAFFALDSDWRFTYVNETAYRLVNRTPGDLIGKLLWEEFPGVNNSKFEQMHRRVMCNRVAETLTEFYPDHNRWYEVRSYPAVNGVTMYFRDVTDRKQSEATRLRLAEEREQLLRREQSARTEAESANRLKDEFLAVLSHELRSPLNPILGWTHLLQTRKLDAARQAEALNTIERNAKLQSQLVEDLLDISRIMQGKLFLTAAAVSLPYVISAATETVRLAAEAKQIQIKFDLDPDIPPISGDAARLQQVVWNLLSNAIKFTPPNGQVTVELRQRNLMAQMRVIDTGKGINPQFLPHVFEYFRQEDGSTTRKFGGLGLGLAIARQIIEMHGGQISVDSAGEGQGTTFTVQIPLASGQLTSSEPPPVSTHCNLNGIQILVVDDEIDSRDIVAFILKQAGANVTSAASGIEALQIIEQSVPNLIIADIGMPDMDGYMLLQQIRRLESGKHLPAIALTAYAGELNRQQALAAGFQQHLPKPVDPEGLVSTIYSLCRDS